MIRNYPLSKKLYAFLSPALLLLLASCGSYQYSGYSSDGIYGEASPAKPSQNERSEKPRNANIVRQEKLNEASSYYKNLFAQQSDMINAALEDSTVFTNIDNYSSNTGYEEDTYDDDSEIVYNGSYAPWGEDPDSYTINIYNNMGPRFGGFYNPYGYYGYDYWDPYWNTGWNWRFSWGASAYYGYGWGWNNFYDPWYVAGWYGYPRYHNYYHYSTPYHYNRYAYNSRHRGERIYSRNSRSNVISQSRSNSRRSSSYSRRIREIRSSEGTRSNRSSRSKVAKRNDSDRPVYTRSSRSSRSSRTYSRSSGSSSNSVRSSSSNNSYRTRSTSPSRSRSVRSSSSSSRSSSGSVRSSSRSSRSSGGSRSARGGRG